MATRSALRARLQHRLGLGVVATTEQARLNEALNAGIARAVADGVPGLATAYLTGGVLGSILMAGAATVIGSSTVTLNVADTALDDDVMPNDILGIQDSSGIFEFLIKDVLTQTTLDIGSPATQLLSGSGASYVRRRSIVLPSSGQVFRVAPVASGLADGLKPSTLQTMHDPFRAGTPRHFIQSWSDTKEQSSISLWPYPSDATEQWTVVQSQFETQMSSDSDELEFPEQALDAVLERSRAAYLVWTGSANQTDLVATGRALADVDNSLRNSATDSGIRYRT